MCNLMGRLLRDDTGATAIEYGLIAAFIALAIIGGATSIGGNLSTIFGNVGSAL
ncbi:MAG TPA: Flp family type IVb pilin [Stellaceae bacterium]|nr:Flp family type IVb pilin [Stellaceae bacterium]